MTLNSGFIYERCLATESREIRRISNIKATNARMTQGTNEIAIGSLLLQSLDPRESRIGRIQHGQSSCRRAQRSLEESDRQDQKDPAWPWNLLISKSDRQDQKDPEWPRKFSMHPAEFWMEIDGGRLHRSSGSDGSCMAIWINLMSRWLILSFTIS